PALPKTRRPGSRAPGAARGSSSPARARHVTQHRLLAGRDRDHESQRVRVLAGELVGLLRDLDVAAHALLDHDLDVRLLAVAELDLDAVFALAVRDALVVGLTSLGDQIERGADLERQALVLGGVADVRLTGELERTPGVGLVDPDPAPRQRHA